VRVSVRHGLDEGDGRERVDVPWLCLRRFRTEAAKIGYLTPARWANRTPLTPLRSNGVEQRIAGLGDSPPHW
jgi:hypothetical protein